MPCLALKTAFSMLDEIFCQIMVHLRFAKWYVYVLRIAMRVSDTPHPCSSSRKFGKSSGGKDWQAISCPLDVLQKNWWLFHSLDRPEHVHANWHWLLDWQYQVGEIKDMKLNYCSLVINTRCLASPQRIWSKIIFRQEYDLIHVRLWNPVGLEWKACYSVGINHR